MFFFYCKRQNASPTYPIDPQAIIQRLTPCNPPDTSGFLARDTGSLPAGLNVIERYGTYTAELSEMAGKLCRPSDR